MTGVQTCALPICFPVTINGDWHAEGLALVRCKDKVPYRLTVERYDNQGEQALAAPCPVCKEMIKAWGVKILEYTSPNGWVKEVLRKISIYKPTWI